MGLTDLLARKIKPKKQRFEILDGNGLYLRVMPTGRKSWVFRYNFEGNARRMTLGSYPAFSLAQAREKHALALQDVEKGIDPGVEAQKEKAKHKAIPTFKDLLDEFWEIELSKKPTGKERRRLIEKDALSHWGKRKVTTITRRDAVILLDRVRERAPITANRVQGVLVRMFNFASERGIIDFSPLAGLRKTKETGRSRVLSDEEIKIFWECMDLDRKDIDIFRPTKLALKSILLTGQRPGEVTGMTWDQIDGDWWTIPAETRKNKEVNRVPILPMFKNVLEQAKVYSNSDHIFPSSHKESSPLMTRTLSNAIRRHRKEMKIEERFTPHDLRRTLRTRLAGLGISDIVAERVLGHKLQGILAIYNRYGYDTEKRQALGLWEKRLQKILGLLESASNVISIDEARYAKKK